LQKQQQTTRDISGHFQMSIESAIRQRALLRFTYDGYVRTVEPHIAGTDRKGQAMLRAFQVAGGTDSGAFVGWKLFHIDKISALETLEERFAEPRPDYRRDDTQFAAVSAQV
jgi:predicted DNA-binding transcriptional regulator YafY